MQGTVAWWWKCCSTTFRGYDHVWKCHTLSKIGSPDKNGLILLVWHLLLGPRRLPLLSIEMEIEGCGSTPWVNDAAEFGIYFPHFIFRQSVGGQAHRGQEPRSFRGIFKMSTSARGLMMAQKCIRHFFLHCTVPFAVKLFITMKTFFFGPRSLLGAWKISKLFILHRAAGIPSRVTAMDTYFTP